MTGLKELCALLLSAGIGAGSVVAVQQAKPPAVKKAAGPKAHKSATPRRVAGTQLKDCPVLAAPIGAGIPDLAALPATDEAPVTMLGSLADEPLLSLPPAGFTLPPGPGAGGPVGPAPPPSPPIAGIPQPASWAMMVAGFGFVGLALRRPGRALPEASK